VGGGWESDEDFHNLQSRHANMALEQVTSHTQPKTTSPHLLSIDHLRLESAHDVDVLRGQLERARLEGEVSTGRHAQDEPEINVDQAALRVQKNLRRFVQKMKGSCGACFLRLTSFRAKFNGSFEKTQRGRVALPTTMRCMGVRIVQGHAKVAAALTYRKTAADTNALLFTLPSDA